MDEKSYEQLMSRIDNILNTHLVTPNPSQGANPDMGFITRNMNFSGFTEDQKINIHTKLHMLYSKKGGKNLSISDIKHIHANLVSDLQNHKKFDRLDN